jgi:hypothetical protein
MLRRIAIIALLGILGFGAGYASTWLGGHRYYMGTLLWLPRHSAHKPAQIVAMTSGRHPGAQVRASGANKISIEASGTVLAVDNAMRVAYKEVVAANDGKFQFLSYYPHFADQWGLAWGHPVRRGLIGLLAGISVALGFLFPARSRVVRCASCSGVVERPRLERQRPERAIAIPVALWVTSGIALVSILLAIAAILLGLHGGPYNETINGAI